MEGKLRPDFRGEVLTVLEEVEEEVEEEAGTWGSLAEDSTFRWTFSTLTAGIWLRSREIKTICNCAKGGCVSDYNLSSHKIHIRSIKTHIHTSPLTAP